MKHVGIVMSAGKGLRIGGDIPKQYMLLEDKPVLYYCLKAMEDSFIDEIVIVAGSGDEEYVRHEIVEKYSLSKVSKIVAGGAERSDSVYNGLRAVREPESTYVYIHDGARPMLTSDILNRVKADVEKTNASVAAVNSKDTVKIIGEDGYVVNTPDRKNVWSIQTPQAFLCSELIAAYDRFIQDDVVSVTDDAMVMELYGNRPVHVCEGDYTNIKITTSEDFLTAKNFLKKIKNVVDR